MIRAVAGSVISVAAVLVAGWGMEKVAAPGNTSETRPPASPDAFLAGLVGSTTDDGFANPALQPRTKTTARSAEQRDGDATAHDGTG